MPVRSPLLDYLIASASTVVGLLATQGLISNQWERTISGIAAVVIPLTYLVVSQIVAAVHAHGAARITAASITATATATGAGGGAGA